MADTTTKKFKEFQATPLKDCKLKDVPGIGDVTLGHLRTHRIDTVDQLIGHFLVLKKDGAKMEKWLVEKCEVKDRYAKDIVEAIARKHEGSTQHAK